MSFPTEELMERRDFMVATGALAFASAAHAAPDAGTAAKAPGLVELGSACIQVGEECQAHCLQQFAAGDTSLAGCARSVTMMLQMCRALVTAAAQSSPRLKEIARACGAVCRDCEAACKPHAGHHDVCRRCMEACRSCAAACEKASG
jgi:Cys-rich four helix bundle protein (predicted Tat secretion target)